MSLYEEAQRALEQQREAARHSVVGDDYLPRATALIQENWRRMGTDVVVTNIVRHEFGAAFANFDFEVEGRKYTAHVQLFTSGDSVTFCLIMPQGQRDHIFYDLAGLAVALNRLGTQLQGRGERYDPRPPRWGTPKGFA